MFVNLFENHRIDNKINSDMAAVNFYLDTHPNKAGECPIKMSVIIFKKRFFPTIGHSVLPEVWNGSRVSKAKYVNSKGETAAKINKDIFNLLSHFTNYINEVEKMPTAEEFKQEMKLALGRVEETPTQSYVKVKTLFDDFDQFIKEESVSNQWAYATMQCWKTFRHHLEAFNRHIRYEDFDEEGINKFVRFLRVRQNLEEKTVQKQFNNLKWFLNWTIRKGYCKQEQINRYRPKFKILEKPVIFLTKEELLRLYNYEIPANGTKVMLKDMNGNEYEKTVQEAGALAKTRDLFCFCAFTSLRYSDMAKVKRSDIVGDCLYITTQKTNDRLPIDLNSFAKAILDKYDDGKYPHCLALPVITNQKMNYYLKDLCELCGFNTPITKVFFRAGQKVEETYPKWTLIGTHAGRRTFICFALASGIPPQVVMKWTGHSDYKAMRPYIDIAEKTRSEAMKLIEQSLSVE